MVGNITMLAKDALSAKLGECFVDDGINRYNMFNMISIEANFEKKKTEVAILGKTGNGNKSTGWKGSGTAKIHYNSSIFRKMMLDFKNTGKDVYFDMQITNEDPNSDAGRQTVILKSCNIDGGILAKFDASSEDTLEEEVSFTFDDFLVPEEFSLLPGMRL